MSTNSDNDTTILEHRNVTIALPPEIWEILDGTHALAIANGGQGMESWIADMILASVGRCLDIALAVRSTDVLTISSKEGNA